MVASLLYFTLGRPLPPANPMNRLINNLLGSFTGRELAHPVIGGRLTNMAIEDDMFGGRVDDATILKILAERDFSPVPDMLRDDHPPQTQPAR